MDLPLEREHSDLFRLGSGPGIRIDTGFEEGDVISPQFHLMLAKIIAWGQNRQEALARLSRALSESAVVVRGGMNNRALLLAILNQPELDKGKIDICWLDRLVAEKDSRPRQYADIALLQAAISAYEAELQVEQTQFFTSAARGRPRARSAAGITMKSPFFQLWVSTCCHTVRASAVPGHDRGANNCYSGRTYRCL